MKDKSIWENFPSRDKSIWGVTIDGIKVDTPLRTYREAREQAHWIATGAHSWYGIEVVNFENPV
jgi:hypothetical protein